VTDDGDDGIDRSHHAPCRVTVLDTLTGRTATDDTVCPFQWAENNWSCDCNRWMPFGDDHEPEEAAPCEHRRYLVIGSDYRYFDFREWNEGYPPDLLERVERATVPVSVWTFTVAGPAAGSPIRP
jgi:hypothetical protein